MHCPLCKRVCAHTHKRTYPAWERGSAKRLDPFRHKILLLYIPASIFPVGYLAILNSLNMLYDASDEDIISLPHWSGRTRRERSRTCRGEGEDDEEGWSRERAIYVVTLNRNLMLDTESCWLIHLVWSGQALLNAHRRRTDAFIALAVYRIEQCCSTSP